MPPLRNPKRSPNILFISLKTDFSTKYEILYVMKDIVMSAKVNPTINESIIISSQLSPKMFITKANSEIVVKIRGEIRYATTIAKIQLKINKISFIRPLK